MQYTLLYIDNPSKIVKMYVALSMEDLKDFKNYHSRYLKDCELHPVDKDGYVWFCEITNFD